MAREERDYSHRSLIEKLGIKPGHRVCLLRVSNRDLAPLVRAHVETPLATSPRGTYDVILYEVNAPGDLKRIAGLTAHLTPAGALWIFHPKGKGASPHENEVRAAGLSCGLVDNKICGYTETHAATRYVIRKERRQPNA